MKSLKGFGFFLIVPSAPGEGGAECCVAIGLTGVTAACRRPINYDMEMHGEVEDCAARTMSVPSLGLRVNVSIGGKLLFAR